MINSETMQSHGCVNVSDGDNCTLVCADSENAVSVPGSIVVCNHGSWSNENICEELGSREYVSSSPFFYFSYLNTND